MQESINSSGVPIPEDEEARQFRLASFHILDTPPEKEFDRLTRLAATICDAPLSLITLIDRDRQWIKSCFGTDIDETRREHAFCAHAILNDDPLVVEDTTEDTRFKDNPYVTGEKDVKLTEAYEQVEKKEKNPVIRSYAGAPLITRDGYRLGTLCVLDTKPRSFSEEQIQSLKDLAEEVIDQLILRARTRSLEAKKQWQNAEEPFSNIILDHLPFSLCAVDEEGVIKYTNEEWRSFEADSKMPDPTIAAPGINYLQTCKNSSDAGDFDAGEAFEGLKSVLNGTRDVFTMEYPCHAPDHERWFLMYVRAIEQEPYGAVIAHMNITDRIRAENKRKEMNKQLQKANEKLEQIATEDRLTGIPNRRKLEEHFRISLANCRRTESAISLVMVDIDNFKTYNDRLGHAAGDDCLKKIASQLSCTLDRETDLIARYGGEEFAALLLYTSREGACDIAEELRINVENLEIVHPGDDQDMVTVSTGVSTLHPAEWDRGIEYLREELAEAADRALYRAKRNGRNRTEFEAFDPPEEEPRDTETNVE